MPALCDILGHDADVAGGAPPGGAPCELARIATWADVVRRRRGYGWSGALHYIGAKEDWRSSLATLPCAGN
jgi:hypothetical protein